MSPIASVFIILGALVALLASIGLVRMRTPYARFHAAGKASPIAFLFVAVGASFEVGWLGAAELAIVAVALLLTLPAATHLLFRATHRTTPSAHMEIDELTDAEQQLMASEAAATEPDTAAETIADAEWDS
ncbi:MAG TPA: monovalent cation/H(+) antiporter subunit G [Ilumatobacteraceae bacterium]|nr:monovalent cation/H(+) antiporter subunit G [Ilumatobacteraceae bacterium]